MNGRSAAERVLSIQEEVNVMHYFHIARYYDWLYRTKAGTTCHERNAMAAMAFEYSQASKDTGFAAMFFRY